MGGSCLQKICYRLLSDDITAGYPCAVFFGIALPREFFSKQRQGLPNEVDYFLKGEQDMDALDDRLAEKHLLDKFYIEGNGIYDSLSVRSTQIHSLPFLILHG